MNSIIEKFKSYQINKKNKIWKKKKYKIYVKPSLKIIAYL